MIVNNYCRNYRLEKKLTLKDICGNENIKNISAFEMGRSSNIKHLESYINYSLSINDLDNFLEGLKGVYCGR